MTGDMITELIVSTINKTIANRTIHTPLIWRVEVVESSSMLLFPVIVLLSALWGNGWSKNQDQEGKSITTDNTRCAHLVVFVTRQHH
jgi:hypothetical protein